MPLSPRVLISLAVRVLCAALTCSGLLVAQAPPTAGCQYEWDPVFAGISGLDGPVRALASFDGGSGPALYAGGSFLQAGGIPIAGLARWDGTSWSSVGGGIAGGTVSALRVLDDGSGPALYVGGNFTSVGGSPSGGVARWNGTTLVTLGTSPIGYQSGSVKGFAVYDFGSGPQLVSGFQKWNGASWQGLLGPNDPMMTAYGPLEVFSVGGVSNLFISAFHLGGAIGRFDGGSWTTMSPGYGTDNCYALTTYDDGSGPALYSAGYCGLPILGGVSRWNGGTWTVVGSGFASGPPPHGDFATNALCPFDDGNGPNLYVTGRFDWADGNPAAGIARWDGSTWLPLGSGLDNFGSALATFDDGSGPALYVGGLFLTAGGLPANHIAKWGPASACHHPGVSVCEPGTAGVIACPCSNPSSGGTNGCNNSAGTGGAHLDATGFARIAHDSVVLAATGEMQTATSVVLQGSQLTQAGIPFGQGVRCVSGLMKRLYIKTAVGGTVTAPEAGDATLAARSAQLGDTIVAGAHRYYGVYYRDPVVLGGCPAMSTYNITQQLDVLWSP